MSNRPDKCVVVFTVTEDTLPDQLRPSFAVSMGREAEFGFTSDNLPVLTTASSLRLMRGNDVVGCYTLEVEYQFFIRGYVLPKEERLMLLLGSQIAFYDRLQAVFALRYNNHGRWLVPKPDEIAVWEGKIVHLSDPVVPRKII